MNGSLFYMILLFFLLGGAGIYFVGRKRSREERRGNWLKYFTYFFIVVFLYGCIRFAGKVFPFVCLLIAFAGLFEIIRLQRKMPQKRIVFCVIIFTYALIAVGFYFFSLLPPPMLLFTFFMVCLFDAFCQIGGQLFGKHKMLPRLSPNKTYEGLFGGLFMVVITSPLMGIMSGFSVLGAVLWAFGICLFSLTGDLSASWVKRRYGVKDFSAVLPGHGGVLDRFDSFMVSGAFVCLIHLFVEMA